MAYTVEKLSNPSDDMLNKAAKVLNAAFANDKAFEAVVGPEHIKKLLPELNRAQLIATSLAGEMYVAKDEGGSIVGICLWFGPGREMYDSENQRTRALERLLSQLLADVRTWYFSSRPRLQAFHDKVLGKGTARSQWYLQRIEILPEFQGRGIGTRLIETVRDEVGDMSIALSTTMENNVGYYEHLGFDLKGSLNVETLYGMYTAPTYPTVTQHFLYGTRYPGPAVGPV